MASSDTITPTYDSASSAKHQPSPTAAMTIPPSDGPMMRLPLTIEELSAMAFGTIAPVLDHLDDQRLPGRRIEGVDQALHDLQHQDLRDRDQSRQRQHGERH